MIVRNDIWTVTLAAVAWGGACAWAQEVPVVVRAVRVAGVSALSSEQVAAAARAALPQELPIDAHAVRGAIEAVEGLYRSRGFTLARVVGYELGPEGILHLQVAEGRIRRILIRGHHRTRESAIRKTLSLQPGDVFQEEAIREDRLRLARLGIFEDVFVAPRSPGAASEDDALEGSALAHDRSQAAPSQATSGTDDEVGLIDLVLRVKERQTGNVAATVGYSDSSGLIGFVDLSENNLLGTAQRASLQWQRVGRVIALEDGTLLEEQPRMAFLLSFAQPALGRHGLGFSAAAYDQDTVFLPTFGGAFETIRSYERRRGGRVSVGANVRSDISLFLTARHDQVGYDGLPDRFSLSTSERAAAAATVGAWGLVLNWDGRSNADSPRDGYLHRLEVEEAGRLLGGTRRFGRVQLDLRQYAALGRDRRIPVAAFRLLGGTSSGVVPLPEKFFLGGFDLLRGYDLFSRWGSRMALATAELRVPLSQGLSGVFFTDLGDAWEAGARARLRAGAGVGLRFASPIGPIRFDIAYGDRLQTYISLGQSF